MTNLEKDLKAGILYSKTASFKRKEIELIEDLENFLSLCKAPYLALSWGKQSIIIAHALQTLNSNIPMLFLRSWESFLLHNFKEVSLLFQLEYSINYIEHFKDNVSNNHFSWKETRDIGANDIQNMAFEVFGENWDGVIMGLSKDESVARRITTSLADQSNIFNYKDGRKRLTPISKWNKMDLAAYLATYNLPLLDVYHRVGLEARTTARITRNNAEMNGLRELKETSISSYNQIVKRFPELSIYT